MTETSTPNTTTQNTVTTKKSSSWLGRGVLIAGLVVLGLYAMNLYNGLIRQDEEIRNLESQVNNMYDRRADLVPQVVAVVKKYAEYEGGVLTGIAGLRSNAAALENMAKAGDTKSEQFGALLASTMGGMKIISENYPTLKADVQFQNLYTTIEGSENRIRTAIMDYNTALTDFNSKVRVFPRNIIANLVGMGAKDRIGPAEGKDFKAVPNVEELMN